MGTYTSNLNLYNTNMSTDGNDTFNFQRDINDNNDKIDAFAGTVSGTVSTLSGTMTAHASNTSNPHSVTKAQVGLGNCDNTSDLNKPISTATQTALNTHTTNKSNPHSVTKTQVGLGNCDNTSDLNKPISTATQTALNGKVNSNGSNATFPYITESYYNTVTGSGYIKYSNKYCEQWGKQVWAVKNATYDVPLTISYKDTNYIALASGSVNYGGGVNARGATSQAYIKDVATITVSTGGPTNEGVGLPAVGYSVCWYTRGCIN